MATDGESVGVSDIRSFTIDITQRPELRLVSPKSDAIFPNNDVTFDWEVMVSGTEELVFDLYLDTGPDLVPNGLWISGLTKSEFTVEDLEPDQTYYWTVTPRFSTGVGICWDGVIKFTIDTSKIAHGLVLDIPFTEKKLEQGEVIDFDLELTNLGSADETIRLEVQPEDFSNSISFNINRFSLNVDAEEKITIKMSIDTSNITVGVHEISFVATSAISPAKDDVSITLEVVKPTSKEDDKSDITDIMSWVPLIIIIIIGIIGAFAISRYKPKDIEDEYLGEVPGGRGTGAEISFKPSLTGVQGDWRPQMSSQAGDQYPAIGPTTTGADLSVPQLPPRQPGQPTPYTPTPEVPTTTPTGYPEPEVGADQIQPRAKGLDVDYMDSSEPGMTGPGAEPEIAEMEPLDTGVDSVPPTTEPDMGMGILPDLDIDLPDEAPPQDVMEPIAEENVIDQPPGTEKIGLMPDELEEMLPAEEDSTSTGIKPKKPEESTDDNN
jgi:hypothetical protein